MTTNELLEIGAYHESGHTVVGYLAGYTVDNIKLSVEDAGSGMTKFNYGKDQLIITALLYPEEFGSTFNTLPKEERSKTPTIGNKLHTVLVAGSCAEAYLQHEIKNNKTGESEISGPDLERMFKIQEVFLLLKIPFPKEKHQENYSRVYETISIGEIWNAIDYLAKEILKTNNYNISKIEIEQHLTDCGFIKYLSTLKRIE